MRVFSTTEEIANAARGAAIALGNFDGVHRGHQAVIAAARQAALELNAPLAAAVFEPHPRCYFQPDTPPFRIQSKNQRASALEALGVNYIFEIGFDAALAAKSGEAFARDVLSARLGARHVSVGADFRFGKNRMGDAKALADWGMQFGFAVTAVSPLGEGGEKFSSSAIRTAIGDGDMARAADLLTRPWAIEGVVQKGFQRGRGIDVPTANVALGEYARPRLGIYAVRVDVGDGAWRAGVASVGVNPTVGTLPAPLLEAHIFDFDADLYGRIIETQLVAFLRPELKFESMEAMRQQIDRDAAQARALLR